MSGRASSPGASELLRPTGEEATDGSEPANPRAATSERADRPLTRITAPRRGSGRQKHDAKITVYVSGDELLAMEHARLKLRGSHGLAVDRGRIVREAVAVVLADFEEHGDDSVLVRRLRGDGVEHGEDTTSR